MPLRSSCRSINSPALSAYSKGFTLIEALVAIGLFIFLSIGSTALYTQWRYTTDHSESVNQIVNLLNTAEHNALSSRLGSQWVIERAAPTQITLRDVSSTQTQTFELPNNSTLDWHGATTFTFSSPDGTVNQPGILTVTTNNRLTDITVRQNGTVALSSTTL